MNRFAELIDAAAVRPNRIVHLGAGACKEYEIYRSLQTQQIILLEPDPGTAQATARKFDKSDDVKIIAQAIAPATGSRKLKISNNARFSSLLKPARLLDFYPNLEIEEEVEVQAISLGQLCKDESLAADGDNLLVAELQGIEYEVFPAATADVLQHFKWILIRSGEQNLYQQPGEGTRVNLPGVLRKAGFTVLVFDEEAPPFRDILCIRDDSVLDKAEIEAEMARLERCIEQLEAGEARLIEEKKAVENDVSKWKAERDQIESKYNKQVSELENARQAAQALTAEKKDLEARIQARAKEYAEMQQTVRINNKLLLKSDADLKDLQRQYRTALEHQEEQYSLLCDLKDKLRQASEFYQKLNLQNLILDGDVLEQPESADTEPTAGGDAEDVSAE